MAKKKKRVRIELVRSTIGKKPTQKRTAKALGLKKMNSTVEHEITPEIMGMVNVISHLVKVEEI